MSIGRFFGLARAAQAKNVNCKGVRVFWNSAIAELTFSGWSQETSPRIEADHLDEKMYGLKSVCLVAIVMLSWASAHDLLLLKQNSEPKYMAANTGLCDQVYIALQRELMSEGIEIEIFEPFLPIPRILKLLENGSAQIFCGASKTEDREQLYRFSRIPVYETSNVLIAHRDERLVPDSLEQMAAERLVIGAFFGTSSAAWLAAHEGIIVNDNFYSLDDAMATVAARRGLRYFFYHDLGLRHYARISDLPLKVLPVKFRSLSQWLIYSPDISDELYTAVEDAMSRLHESGELQSIQQQYL